MTSVKLTDGELRTILFALQQQTDAESSALWSRLVSEKDKRDEAAQIRVLRLLR